MEREFKYYRDSFAQLPVTVHHMDLDFDVYEDHVDANTALHVTPKQPISQLDLNADSLEIHEVSCDQHEVSFEYEKEQKMLHVKFDKEIPSGERIIIRTKSTCKPTKNILEGVYFDETPHGCPCTMITQCQQWGFQRIVPCIDDMSAKCTYHTTIKGDKRYTNIITNGDPKQLMKDMGDGRVECMYDNTVTPMATYLFFMGLGTYATFKKEFRYPDGDTFTLELLVPPDSDEMVARQALDILHDAVMWVHLFTGRDRYKNMDASHEILRLMKEEKFAEAKEKAKDLHLGYKYTGKVYREIGMQNSNFGGMENVGNTTITTNRIMPYPYMSDRGFEYMIMVKVHEFYHNLNGSEVTGATPFEFWLNEAVTVFTEQTYSQFILGEDYERLETIFYIVDPQDGILAMDRSPAAMPIEPIGFNTPDELVGSITYIKSPEVVRMVETLMGKETFVKGLDLYHTRYKHSNATSDQWFEAMSEASGIDFTKFMNAWIRQKGHPTVTLTTRQEEEKLFLTVTQSDYGELSYEYPFTYAIFSKEGKLLTQDMVYVKEVEQTIEIPLQEEVGFISANRSFSAFIDFEYAQTPEELYLQLEHDDDLYNKNVALNKLFAAERLRLLKDKDAVLDEKLVELYGSLFLDKELQEKIGVQHIAVLDYVDKEFLHKYQELYEVRERMFLTIAKRFEKEFLELYDELSGKEYFGTLVEKRLSSLKDRSVKNTALGIVSRLDTPEIREKIKRQFLTSINASDKLSAFSFYLRSKADDRLEIIRSYEQEAKQNLVTWEAFLVGVASNQADDALDFIKEIEQSKDFRIEQANDQRGLFAVFAGNKRKSLLTVQGRDYLKHIALLLAPINEYNCLRALDTLDVLNHLDKEPQQELVKMIIEILEELKSEKHVDSVVSYLKRTLKGSGKARAAYEEKYGKLELQ
ncbi:MAG: M1 family metallopeptidase [Nanoarchaeota archaeon]|nr:M1 family metallopeptidase [Nanoarchaeota archaeon]